MKRLTPRERKLALGVGVVAAIFLNVYIIDYFTTRHAQLRKDIAARTKQLENIRTLTAERAVWEQRSTWLDTTRPKTENPTLAGVELLEQVRALAKAHQVQITNPNPRETRAEGDYVSVSLNIETKSSWKSLIGFLGALQAPDKFIVLETANLKVDTADQTQMHGRFRIAKWFAPS